MGFNFDSGSQIFKSGMVVQFHFFWSRIQIFRNLRAAPEFQLSAVFLFFSEKSEIWQEIWKIWDLVDFVFREVWNFDFRVKKWRFKVVFSIGGVGWGRPSREGYLNLKKSRFWSLFFVFWSDFQLFWRDLDLGSGNLEILGFRRFFEKLWNLEICGFGYNLLRIE